ncbi:DUF5916 domain-containing protein [Aliiglaciecola sp. LCG003]|uniref:carbohydrate binding family 9 domain-containing protein n=1 Tax=Aliiglaciecola sp. LCG003 TaxID=3053655 RepID=UPI0025747D9F|nr:DUF5916 domain-containing protein [Aliiglaciecola sp. LCG003]WJG09769.1 DUF5916 domain-containing protein [Aliiglaciecola sp. LCG003]
MSKFIAVVIYSFAAIASQLAIAQSHQHSAIVIPNIKGEVTLDGDFDEPQWASAKLISLDYVVRPHENTQPPVTTKVRIFEDDKTLYIGFTAQDPNPSDISAFYRDRDKVWSEDLVGFKLDTFYDSRLAYQFFVNPLGIQSDSIQNEMTGKESDSWNAIWDSVGKITADGYQVEIAIPLRILNFKEGEQDKIWGAEFVRFYPREERLRISNLPTDRNNACNLCQLGSVKGFKQAKQGQNLALVPTLVMAKQRSREPAETLEWDRQNNQEVGMDISWGITPEVSLQATLNPDFSQVESDIAQLSINNTNALFFAERRTFFLENADYFSSNYNLVHTRNVNAPDYGLKVSGRMDQHSLGVFVANDQTTTFLIPGNLSSDVAELSEGSKNMALRYRYDFSSDLSLGVVGTAREADSYHNYVTALDSKYQLSDQDTLRIQWARSQTQYPSLLYQDYSDETQLRLKNDGEFNGQALRVNYRHNERNWNFRADHYRNGKDFRADLGFERNVDRNTSVIGGAYRWFSEHSWWNRIEVWGDWDIAHNDDGELLEKEAEIYTSIRGKWQSYLELGVQSRDKVGVRQQAESLRVDNNATLFHEDQASLYFDIRPSPSVYFGVYTRYGDNIDYDNNRLGKQININPKMNLSLGKHLQLNIRHTYRQLKVNDANLFTANLTDARLTYQFDPRQYIRLIVVHSDIKRNLDNYIIATDDYLKRSKVLSTQLLYSYKINPLTKFFVGYTDSGFQDDDVSIHRLSEQSIFMKFSYAWLN